MFREKVEQVQRRRRHILRRSLFAAVLFSQWVGQALSQTTDAPLYGPISGGEPAAIDLGRSLFNTEWLPAGGGAGSGPSAGRREGLGPLFNSASCAGCHGGGEGGRGPAGDGSVPISLEIQLDSINQNASGDPVYGHVFSTAAVPGARAEGSVSVRYEEIYGYYYPDGTRWRIRVPYYQLTDLSRGPLLGTTLIKPRVGPSLFGVGLLELIPEPAISNGASGKGGVPSGVAAWHEHQHVRSLGRFGWQADSLSIRDQTTKAMAGEMGLTTVLRPQDDCTPTESDCLTKSAQPPPKVSEELVDALVAFQRSYGVPPPAPDDHEAGLGRELFESIGCASCHRPRMPVSLTGSDGKQVSAFIAPYSDLRLHYLGTRMSDATVSGRAVRSLWRTAPLWGLGYRITVRSHMTYLHDGRARSAEEAILWHGGEADPARQNFMNMGPRSRRALLHWIERR